jgi:hypothetical protein
MTAAANPITAPDIHPGPKILKNDLIFDNCEFDIYYTFGLIVNIV